MSAIIFIINFVFSGEKTLSEDGMMFILELLKKKNFTLESFRMLRSAINYFSNMSFILRKIIIISILKNMQSSQAT